MRYLAYQIKSKPKYKSMFGVKITKTAFPACNPSMVKKYMEKSFKIRVREKKINFKENGKPVFSEQFLKM